MTETDTAAVTVGPDLNDSRAPLDKKLYRQILLPNGLRAVLISDTVAMHHQSPYENYLDGSEDNEEDEKEDDRHNDSHGEEEEEGESEDEGLREAAAAMVVGVGSYSDPCEAQGMAHFLEHMLFMGTKKFPEENAYSAFMAKNGGSENAYTELEHTIYHLNIPQEELFPALDMFAQFFVHPLLLEDAVERELHSIESEFQLVKNSDHCRLQQLMCHTSGRSVAQHPFAKFSWGNLKSLKEAPLKSGTNIMGELRKFYNQFYYAGNMKLVVVGAYSLDVLQRHVLEYFQDIPATPREPSPLQAKHVNAGTWEETYHSATSKLELPFQKECLGRIFRIVPVQNRHSLSVTWQVPSQIHNWRSKPCDFIAHLIGHEAQGSLLSSLKEKSWAYECFAGVGDDGMENASSHALFIATFSLSEEGVPHWSEVVNEVYQYIGMLRHYCSLPEGLPEWIYEELRNIHEVSYRYGDEPSSDDLVQQLAEDLAPHVALPPEHLLDGTALLFDHDAEQVKNLLDKYLTPLNARLDLMSATYGRAADFEGDEGYTNTESLPEVDDASMFEIKSAGPPKVEPIFGTRYWCHEIPKPVMDLWTAAAEPQLPSPESLLSLPPKNPFVPERYTLKELPADDDDHPLVHASLKLCISVGKTKSWFPATVARYNGVSNQILLTYEDEDEKWHALDMKLSQLKSVLIGPGYEGTLDGKSIKFRVVALAKDGNGPQMRYGDDSDHHVGEGVQFPPIPPALPPSRLPQLISDTQVLKFWHLQDRVFKRPIAEFRLSLICAAANQSPLHQAAADLLVQLCHDAVTETSYLASVCELGSAIAVTDVGFTLRVHGFDDKLLDLFRLIFGTILSFRGQSCLPGTVKEGRFGACLELQQRKYANRGMKASKLCSSVRIQCLRPSLWSSYAKAKALEGIDEATFCRTISEVLSFVGIEALYYGNLDRADAEVARDLVLDMLKQTGHAGLPTKQYPAEPVIKIPPLKTPKDVVVPSKDPTDPNTAVEVYFQVGKDNVEERVLLDLLAQMLEEPLYDQVRTKDQFGYEVTCDSRWTCGVMGMYFRVVTSEKSAEETVRRIDKFLMDFYGELIKMSQEEFMVEVVGLAKNKLDMHDSLADACDSLWSEIRDWRYAWQVERVEVLSLRGVTKERVLEAYKKWLLPFLDGKPTKRRMFTVQVIGTSDGLASTGRPTVKDDLVGDYIDNCVCSYHKSVGNQIWGKIY